jgi:hypothetical protein
VLRRLPNAKLWLLEYPKESQAQLRQVIAVLDRDILSQLVGGAEYHKHK